MKKLNFAIFLILVVGSSMVFSAMAKAESSWSKESLDKFCRDVKVVWRVSPAVKKYLDENTQPEVFGDPTIEGVLRNGHITCLVTFRAEPVACIFGAQRIIEISYPWLEIESDIHHDDDECRFGT